MQQTCFSVSKLSVTDSSLFSTSSFPSVSAFIFSSNIVFSWWAEEMLSSKLETLLSKLLFSWVTSSNLLLNSCTKKKKTDKRGYLPWLQTSCIVVAWFAHTGLEYSWYFISLIMWLTPSAGRIGQILYYDWLLERARWRCLAKQVIRTWLVKHDQADSYM